MRNFIQAGSHLAYYLLGATTIVLLSLGVLELVGWFASRRRVSRADDLVAARNPTGPIALDGGSPFPTERAWYSGD
jgi:hypothetical protein